MRPKTQNLTFININGNTGTKLAGVNNKITINGRASGNQMSNTNGIFVIEKIRATDKISIVSSKSGYNTNSSKVRNRKLNELDTQDKRTIPLNKKSPPPPPPDDEFKGESGDLRINLQWKTYDDLDLFVTDPCGKTVWALELTQRCAGGVGILDIDANTNRYPQSTWTRKAQENAFWEKPNKGKYIIKVEHCNKQDKKKRDPVKFNVTVIYDGKRSDFKGQIRAKQKNYVTTFEVK